LPNPIHQEGDSWYFWDETWAFRYGPYKTREEAERELDRYCKTVLNYEGDKKNTQ